MSQNTRKDARGIKRLLDFAGDAELTDEEVRAELKLDGVDPDEVTKRILANVAAKRKAARLAAWQPAAQQKAELFKARASSDKYVGLPRAELLALASARPLQQVAFRNFDDVTDDDLRTLLADSDELDQGTDE